MSVSPTDVLIPRETANDDTVIVVRYHVNDGGLVREGDPVADIETSKATITLDSPGTGYIRQMHALGDAAPVGSAIARIFDSSEAAQAAQLDVGAKTARVREPGRADTPQLSAAVRAEMQRRNIDPAAFEGRSFVRMSDLDTVRGKFHPASPSKRFEVDYLTAVARESAPSTLFAVARTAGTLAQLNQGEMLLRASLLPIVIFEVAHLLPKFPLLNAAYRDRGAFVYDEVVIGLAIDLGMGLRVVSIPREALSTVSALETAILQIALDYGNNRLRPQDLVGSTFTITDLSAEGVTSFVPILNREQSAILGIGASPEKGEHTFALTFDHRVTEGRNAALFLKELIGRVQVHGQTT